MNHKISDLCKKVNVMYEMSCNLRRLKYDIPKQSRTREETAQIDWLITDIQSLARDIANDTQPYNKVKTDNA